MDLRQIMKNSEKPVFATIPMEIVGPIKIVGSEVNDDVRVPLATFE